jgi:hypothetical protein
MNIKDIVKNMPLLSDMRPDFMLDKFEEVMRMAAIKMAEVGQFLEREYCVELQCGVSDFVLDNCGDETIHTIKRLCLTSACDDSASCGEENKFVIVANGWCSSRSCGRARFRFIPDGEMIQIDQPELAAGFLVITATVAPKYDACELDDLFTSKYRTALFYATAALAFEMPGEGQSMPMATKYAARASDELTLLAVRRMTGHTNVAPVLKARRMV